MLSRTCIADIVNNLPFSPSFPHLLLSAIRSSSGFSRVSDDVTPSPSPPPGVDSLLFPCHAWDKSYAHCSAFMSRRMTERGFVNREWKMAVYPRSKPRSGVIGGDIWESWFIEQSAQVTRLRTALQCCERYVTAGIHNLWRSSFFVHSTAWPLSCTRITAKKIDISRKTCLAYTCPFFLTHQEILLLATRRLLS